MITEYILINAINGFYWFLIECFACHKKKLINVREMQSIACKIIEGPIEPMYLRDGSNPVLNGHGNCAVVPAAVSDQHNHPSHVPRQKLPI